MLPPLLFDVRAAAKMKAEFNAEIAELRRELLAQHDAMVTQIKAVIRKRKLPTRS